MNEKPVIGITMGDPCGNGPEISVKLFKNRSIYEKCRPFIVGDANCIEYAIDIAEKIGIVKEKSFKVNAIKDIDDAHFEYGCIDVYDLGIIKDLKDRIFGKPSILGGEASFQYVVKDIELAMEGKVDATVTNALSKEAINMAGHHYSGHTEIYADYTHTDKYSMMLACGDLRVVHVSTHVSLRKACDLVKKGRVLDCIKLADSCCRAIGIQNPKIGVAGLNPHCGEDGMFGREEIEEIQPAIDEALKLGLNVVDGKASPADTIFSKALGGWYDIVVVMYHDQGHIPLKVKGFVYNKDLKRWDAVEGVNVTLGLPIIRVSVDHGTGFGHAGQGFANELSLTNALDYAVKLARNKLYEPK